MSLSRLLAIGAFAATVGCNGSMPTNPNAAGRLPSQGGQTSSSLPSSAVGVTIQDFAFSPSSLAIKAGTTVRWTNRGPSAHTTTSDLGVWDSGPLSPPGSGGALPEGVRSAGGTFDFKFMQPGTFPYHCAIHPPSRGLYPGFIGTVTVTQ